MDEEERPLDRSPYYVTHSEHLDRVLSRPQLAGKLAMVPEKRHFVTSQALAFLAALVEASLLLRVP